MRKISIVTLLLFVLTVGKSLAQDISTAQLFLDLPDTFNSPASADIDSMGNIYFTSPNFHNDVLIKAGEMETPAPPTIGKINSENQLSTWYTFQPEDMEKKSGKAAPMGIGFGPDGNAYVVDMQMWFGGQSRILRINVKDGKATGIDVVAVGFSFPNAVIFRGEDMFVSDTVLKTEKGKTTSGLYKLHINDLDPDNPAKIQPYINDREHDPRLLETFVSNGTLGFGANGLAIDDKGNIYTALMEDGSVVKTRLDEQGNKIETTLFADGMLATDGMKWDSRTNRIYIADLFANAIYSIDMKGNVQLLAENGDTDGANGQLDGPSEVTVRGNEVIVMNFDAVFDSPDMINKKADKVHSLSVIPLK